MRADPLTPHLEGKARLTSCHITVCHPRIAAEKYVMYTYIAGSSNRVHVCIHVAAHYSILGGVECRDWIHLAVLVVT